MAYSIVYENGEQKPSGGGFRRCVLTVSMFLFFLWAVTSFWPEGRDVLKTLLIPGDPETTLRAAEVFAQELSSGFSLSDASKNFCIAVLEYGCPG